MGTESELFRIVGYRVEKIEEGRAELSFPFSRAIARRGGMVHGGVVMYTLDNAAGIAVMTVNGGTDQVTLELKVNFLEPLRKGPFRAVGKVLRAGGNTVVAEGEVSDAEGLVCARGLGTWYIIGNRRDRRETQ
ncbi:MAG: PaaI family thioesterase [Nitrososphaerota archaeon]|nr:PaaI family thioesterase [Nitrososphaerota archaeon]